MAAALGDWIAVDWGTTNMRAWLVGADGVTRAGALDGVGMASLSPDAFEPALLEAIGPWLDHTATPFDVLVCGMAGARQGWREASYVSVPAPLDGLLQHAIDVPVSDARLRVRIVPGVCQSEPADVMRGEETQLAGLMATQGFQHGTVCLPGTHAKWARIEDRRLVGFATALTGELHALLRDHSILRHSVDDAWNDAAFDSGVADAFEAGGAVLPMLFGLRAGGLLHARPEGFASARLSGLLIGADVASHRGHASEVHIVGAGQLPGLYARALETLGAGSVIHDGDALAVAGLHAMRQEGRRAGAPA